MLVVEEITKWTISTKAFPVKVLKAPFSLSGNIAVHQITFIVVTTFVTITWSILSKKDKEHFHPLTIQQWLWNAAMSSSCLRGFPVSIRLMVKSRGNTFGLAYQGPKSKRCFLVRNYPRKDTYVRSKIVNSTNTCFNSIKHSNSQAHFQMIFE